MDTTTLVALDQSLRRFEREFSTLRAIFAAAVPVAQPAEAPVVQPAEAPVAAPPAPAPPPTPPPRGGLDSKLAAFSIETFFAGRGLQLIGAFLVLLGTAFFLNLAFTRGWIGPGERILLGLVCGVALVGAGARALRARGTPIAEGLAGVGAGILYLSLWASVAVFPQLHVSRSAAFAAMIAVTAILVLLAATRRSERVALLGLVGGFITPVLLNSAEPHRAILAAYILVLGAAFVALGARARFRLVLATAFVGSVLYLPQFVPAGQWTPAAAYGVTTAIFALFAIGFTAGAARDAVYRSARLLFLGLDAVVYVGMLAWIFRNDHTSLGIALLVLSAASLVAARYVGAPRSFTVLYGYLGITTVTLALPALLHGYVLLDSVACEGALLTVVGGRHNLRAIATAGALLLAAVTVWLIGETIATPPLNSAFSSLALAYAIVIAAIGLARKSFATLLRDEPEIGVCIDIAGVALNLLALVGISRVLLDALGGPAWSAAVPSQAQVGLSLAWAAYATALVGFGLSRRSHLAQRQGLVLLAVTILKVFAVDLGNVDLTWRIVSFVVLGVVCMGVSAWYMRTRARTDREAAD